MTYRTAKEGQTVFYDDRYYSGDRCRQEVEFIGYRRSHSDLVSPNLAVIKLQDVPVWVPLTDIYKTQCRCDH